MLLRSAHSHDRAGAPRRRGRGRHDHPRLPAQPQRAVRAGPPRAAGPPRHRDRRPVRARDRPDPRRPGVLLRAWTCASPAAQRPTRRASTSSRASCTRSGPPRRRWWPAWPVRRGPAVSAWWRPATWPWPPTPRRSRSPRCASASCRPSSPSRCSPACSPAPPTSCSSPARPSTPTAPPPIGLINAAVPPDRLDAEVARYVGLLRLGAPGALAATKALLQRPFGDDLGAAFAAMQELSARHFASAEGQEGMAAFAEKRPPAWVQAP